MSTSMLLPVPTSPCRRRPRGEVIDTAASEEVKLRVRAVEDGEELVVRRVKRDEEEGRGEETLALEEPSSDGGW